MIRLRAVQDTVGEVLVDRPSGRRERPFLRIRSSLDRSVIIPLPSGSGRKAGSRSMVARIDPYRLSPPGGRWPGSGEPLLWEFVKLVGMTSTGNSNRVPEAKGFFSETPGTDGTRAGNSRYEARSQKSDPAHSKVCRGSPASAGNRRHAGQGNGELRWERVLRRQPSMLTHRAKGNSLA